MELSRSISPRTNHDTFDDVLLNQKDYQEKIAEEERAIPVDSDDSPKGKQEPRKIFNVDDEFIRTLDKFFRESSLLEIDLSHVLKLCKRNPESVPKDTILLEQRGYTFKFNKKQQIYVISCSPHDKFESELLCQEEYKDPLDVDARSNSSDSPKGKQESKHEAFDVDVLFIETLDNYFQESNLQEVDLSRILRLCKRNLDSIPKDMFLLESSGYLMKTNSGILKIKRTPSAVKRLANKKKTTTIESNKFISSDESPTIPLNDETNDMDCETADSPSLVKLTRFDIENNTSADGESLSPIIPSMLENVENVENVESDKIVENDKRSGKIVTFSNELVSFETTKSTAKRKLESFETSVKEASEEGSPPPEVLLAVAPEILINRQMMHERADSCSETKFLAQDTKQKETSAKDTPKKKIIKKKMKITTSIQIIHSEVDFSKERDKLLLLAKLSTVFSEEHNDLFRKVKTDLSFIRDRLTSSFSLPSEDKLSFYSQINEQLSVLEGMIKELVDQKNKILEEYENTEAKREVAVVETLNRTLEKEKDIKSEHSQLKELCKQKIDVCKTEIDNCNAEQHRNSGIDNRNDREDGDDNNSNSNSNSNGSFDTVAHYKAMIRKFHEDLERLLDRREDKITVEYFDKFVELKKSTSRFLKRMKELKVKTELKEEITMLKLLLERVDMQFLEQLRTEHKSNQELAKQIVDAISINTYSPLQGLISWTALKIQQTRTIESLLPSSNASPTNVSSLNISLNTSLSSSNHDKGSRSSPKVFSETSKVSNSVIETSNHNTLVFDRDQSEKVSSTEINATLQVTSSNANPQVISPDNSSQIPTTTQNAAFPSKDTKDSKENSKPQEDMTTDNSSLQMVNSVSQNAFNDKESTLSNSTTPANYLKPQDSKLIYIWKGRKDYDKLEDIGGKVCLSYDFSKTNHIVTDDIDINLMLFQMIASGKWILKHSWIEKSISSGNFISEVEHEWKKEDYSTLNNKFSKQLMEEKEIKAAVEQLASLFKSSEIEIILSLLSSATNCRDNCSSIFRSMKAKIVYLPSEMEIAIFWKTILDHTSANIILSDPRTNLSLTQNIAYIFIVESKTLDPRSGYRSRSAAKTFMELKKLKKRNQDVRVFPCTWIYEFLVYGKIQFTSEIQFNQ